MSHDAVTQLVAICAGVAGVAAFVGLVLVPAVSSYQRAWERVAAGAGLPGIVRAAARALDASLVLIDRTSVVLAVAARSPAEERALLREAEGVERVELRVADAVVGQLRLRGREGSPDPSLLRFVTTLVASEVERVRGPERASEAAAAEFLHAVLRREIADRGDLVARGKELGIALDRGARRRRRPGRGAALLRRHRHLPAAAAAHERSGRTEALLRRDGLQARRLRRAVRDLRPRRHAGDVPRVRRQRERDGGAPHHP